MDVAAISAKAQKGVLDAIPSEWKIDVQKYKQNLDSRGVPAASGILSSKEVEITELNAIPLLEKIHSGELSAEEVTRAFCARAAIAQQMVNCLTEFFPQEAIEYAKSLDVEFAKTKKPIGPLHGMPIAIKDMYDLIGKRTTVGYVSWYDKLATKDASLVKVMKDAGAVIFGKTTMPQTGMALETWSNLWGRTLNPFNSKFGSGGSSGGDGALVAMRGAPCAPLSSDIGGSIRAPAAFNGLYGMRPSADRIPRGGLVSTIPGNVSIKTSCGPNCHSIADLKLMLKLILTHTSVPYEPSCVAGSWTDVPTPSGKLSIGLISTDGIVDPHPPLQRAMKETAAKLRAAGHDVFEWSPPVDLWQVALTTWALYFQTGAVEAKAAIAASGESTLPTFQHNLNIFKTKPLTVPELFKHNATQLEYKYAFSDAWTATEKRGTTNRPMDVLICPTSPMAGVPHSFPVWWGYTTLFNILDWPSIIMPVKDMKIDPVKDAKDANYKPRDNPFDEENWKLYDPELWSNMPVTLQFVGRPCKDEELVAVCERLDKDINGTK